MRRASFVSGFVFGFVLASGPGYPSFGELVDAYSARAGIGAPDLSWYGAFAAYKLGVIAEGIHFRFSRGETVGAGFDRIGALVEPIAGEGLRQLGSGRR